MNVLAHVGDAGSDPLQAHLHPDVVAMVAAVILAYWAALRFVGPREVEPGEEVVTRRQRWMLVTAIAGLFVASEWPIHDLGEGYLYSVHMVQHSLYTLLLPPLFVLGTPVWLWRWLLRPVLPLVRWLVNPAVAVTIFSAVTVLTHLPAFVEAAVRSGPAHLAQHVALVLSAVVVWWPLVGPLPELRRLEKPISRVVYPFFQLLAGSIAGSFLVWAQEPLYPIYGEYPRLWGISTLADQQWAGFIMEVAEGGVMFGLMLFVVYHSDRQRRRRRPASTETAASAPLGGRGSFTPAGPGGSSPAPSP